jgi:hypothetical protein
MSQDFGSPITPDIPKKSNTTLIIVIVIAILVLCCCCPAIGYGIYWLYQNGDQFLGGAVQPQFIPLLI